MFIDKNRPLTVSVSTVSHFEARPGVKSYDTVDTVDTDTLLPPPCTKPQVHGYVLQMITTTGVWYYSGFNSPNTRLAWTQDIQRVKVSPGLLLLEKAAARIQAEIADLFGVAAIIGPITARPVTIVNHRNILLEDEDHERFAPAPPLAT